MITENIILYPAYGLIVIGLFLFIKYNIEFMKLCKERDGYYFFKPRRNLNQEGISE